jgi:hypothetical protein
LVLLLILEVQILFHQILYHLQISKTIFLSFILFKSTLLFSINKNDCHKIIEKLLKVKSNTNNPNSISTNSKKWNISLLTLLWHVQYKAIPHLQATEATISHSLCSLLKTLLWLKCRAVVTFLFLSFNLCLSLMLDRGPGGSMS